MGCSQSKPQTAEGTIPSTSFPSTANANTANNNSTTTSRTSKKSKHKKGSAGPSSSSTGSVPTRDRVDSWGGGSHASGGGPIPPPQSPTSSGSQYVSQLEGQWKFLWETQSRYIVDPADVSSVMDHLMDQQINKLSVIQLLFLQRTVRTTVKQLTTTPASSTSNGSGGSSTASGTILMNGSSNNSNHHSKLELEAKTLVDKHHVLNDIVLQRILPPSLVQSTIITLLLHLTNDTTGNDTSSSASSSSLWNRVADIAQQSATKAKLTMDVNKQPPVLEMPKPSIVPEIVQPHALPSGVSLQALSYVLALAIQGTRRQKLALLFTILLGNENDDSKDDSVRSLTQVLSQHPAGGVPTWLLEIDNDIVFSLASLTHYHYYGTAFLPHALQPTQQQTKSSSSLSAPQRKFVPSQSRKPIRISLSKVRSVLTQCGLQHGTTNSSTTASTNNGPLPPPSTKRRNSHSRTPERTSSSSGNTSTVGGFFARRPSQNDLDGPSTNTTATRSASGFFSSKKPLQHELEHTTGNFSVPIHDSELTRRVRSNRCPPPSRTLMERLSKARAALDKATTTSLTMQDFCDWADHCLDPALLDWILEQLFVQGVLPTAALEKEVVSQAWIQWQQASVKDVTKVVMEQQEHAVVDGKNSNGPQQSALSSSSSSANTPSPLRGSEIWGGVGGVDGGGGTGSGVMYCVDKKWWDQWATYVGWSFLGDTSNGKAVSSKESRRRPGSLSNERLLDVRGENLGGTLGSYEVMNHGLKKNIDYVLVPPGVWNLLFELYGGGPPLPRMIRPPERKFSDFTRRLTSEVSDMGSTNGPVDLDEMVESVDNGDDHVLRIPPHLAVDLHPWIIHVQLCDPSQPYRRGEVGSLTIRVMASPDQPLWRLFVETIVRFPLHSFKAFDADNRGKARLWKKVEKSAPKDPVSRYGPWNLLCKSRYATVPVMSDLKKLSDEYDDLVKNWEEYADDSTVESIGLADGDSIMLEFAVLNKSGDLAWPREAAAKAGRVRRLAEEDMKFRNHLQGLDEKGNMMLKPPSLVGMKVDAMDASGRWYAVEILESEIVDDDTDEERENDDLSTGKSGGQVSRKKVRVDFSEHGGHVEWIDVDSDRLAVDGRFTSDAERQSSDKDGKAGATADSKARPLPPVKKTSASDSSDTGKLCLFPGFGACGLTNLGNTCYINSAIQCISYMPLLRAYLVSAQYKCTGDLNKDNPLGTGGKLLEEFADLIRVLWSGRLGEKSASRFRTILGKVNSQFSGADQQDAQEFLNYILDMLHEDSNKVRKKPYVEALEDDWVKKNTLGRVGDEAWRRFLRRNRSIMTDIGMGQVLNTVTCPVCNFSSRNFDPFNSLSVPIPTVADVVFKCTVIRRATAYNCPWVLNRPRKGAKTPYRFTRRASSSPTVPPSEENITEQYVISMSRLADSGDLRLQIQNACGIPANQLRLCRAEEVIVDKDEDRENRSVVTRHMKVIPLTDKEGPCSQLAKKRVPGSEEGPAPVTHVVAFETTLRPRLMPPAEEGEEAEPLEDTADEDEEIDDHQIIPSPKEQAQIKKFLSFYGDEQECRLVDTNPLVISKAVSRSLWPRTESELKVGLRVDARDHRGNWFPGNVVEIVDDETSAGDADTGEEVQVATRKVRVHFDNYSSKWDEMYTIDHFERGSVRPLYSHAAPRGRPCEFIVHNRHTDRVTKQSVVFGQSFYVTCQNEWSNARAGAHILAQASRFLRYDTVWGSDELNTSGSSDQESKARRLYEKTQSTISDLIDLLIGSDREYIRLALGLSEHNSEEEKRGQPFRNPSFDSSTYWNHLAKKLSVLLHRLPFEVRICSVESSQGDKTGAAPASEEFLFPFSLIRTIGNFMNARHAVILQWRAPPIDKKSGSLKYNLESPVMYIEPKLEIDRASAEMLKAKAASSAENEKKNKGGSAGIDLGVCLTEFCKVQNLSIADNWRCPHCKKYREGKQSMSLWRLPDLLTLHIKRFNMSARWREKITTKVNFPLTGLDMSEWCHKESPMAHFQSSDGYMYDLIGVVNHYGSMTGGHYVATCRATACGRDGREEVAYNYNGVGANSVEIGEDPEEPTGWRLGRSKVEVNPAKIAAAMTSQSVAESSEPLWLQFDDELVEPIPPRLVVSEMAYVLFYRRRNLSPANISKYSTLIG